ncbi:MAG: hypothetical protein LBT26_02335 [Clostridiales Family XIII bacterium]|jgi:hypothetical protein|nr:hypothetical protein [Clostridiales Family XIII bacterium]
MKPKTVHFRYSDPVLYNSLLAAGWILVDGFIAFLIYAFWISPNKTAITVASGMAVFLGMMICAYYFVNKFAMQITDRSGTADFEETSVVLRCGEKNVRISYKDVIGLRYSGKLPSNSLTCL